MLSYSQFEKIIDDIKISLSVNDHNNIRKIMQNFPVIQRWLCGEEIYLIEGNTQIVLSDQIEIFTLAFRNGNQALANMIWNSTAALRKFIRENGIDSSSRFKAKALLQFFREIIEARNAYIVESFWNDNQNLQQAIISLNHDEFNTLCSHVKKHAIENFYHTFLNWVYVNVSTSQSVINNLQFSNTISQPKPSKPRNMDRHGIEDYEKLAGKSVEELIADMSKKRKSNPYIKKFKLDDLNNIKNDDVSGNITLEPKYDFVSLLTEASSPSLKEMNIQRFDAQKIEPSKYCTQAVSSSNHSDVDLFIPVPVSKEIHDAALYVHHYAQKICYNFMLFNEMLANKKCVVSITETPTCIWKNNVILKKIMRGDPIMVSFNQQLYSYCASPKTTLGHLVFFLKNAKKTSISQDIFYHNEPLSLEIRKLDANETSRLIMDFFHFLNMNNSRNPQLAYLKDFLGLVTKNKIRAFLHSTYNVFKSDKEIDKIRRGLINERMHEPDKELIVEEENNLETTLNTNLELGNLYFNHGEFNCPVTLNQNDQFRVLSNDVNSENNREKEQNQELKYLSDLVESMDFPEEMPIFNLDEFQEHQTSLDQDLDLSDQATDTLNSEKNQSNKNVLSCLDFHKIIDHFKSSLLAQNHDNVLKIRHQYPIVEEWICGKTIYLADAEMKISPQAHIDIFALAFKSNQAIANMIWQHSIALRRFMRGDDIDITDKNQAESLLHFFREALRMRDLIILKDLWKDNTNLQKIIGGLNFEKSHELSKHIQQYADKEFYEQYLSWTQTIAQAANFTAPSIPFSNVHLPLGEMPKLDYSSKKSRKFPRKKSSQFSRLRSYNNKSELSLKDYAKKYGMKENDVLTKEGINLVSPLAHEPSYIEIDLTNGNGLAKQHDFINQLLSSNSIDFQSLKKYGQAYSMEKYEYTVSALSRSQNDDVDLFFSDMNAKDTIDVSRKMHAYIEEIRNSFMFLIEVKRHIKFKNDQTPVKIWQNRENKLLRKIIRGEPINVCFNQEQYRYCASAKTVVDNLRFFLIKARASSIPYDIFNENYDLQSEIKRDQPCEEGLIENVFCYLASVESYFEQRKEFITCFLRLLNHDNVRHLISVKNKFTNAPLNKINEIRIELLDQRLKEMANEKGRSLNVSESREVIDSSRNNLINNINVMNNDLEDQNQFFKHVLDLVDPLDCPTTLEIPNQDEFQNMANPTMSNNDLVRNNDTNSEGDEELNDQELSRLLDEIDGENKDSIQSTIHNPLQMGQTSINQTYPSYNPMNVANIAQQQEHQLGNKRKYNQFHSDPLTVTEQNANSNVISGVSAIDTLNFSDLLLANGLFGGDPSQKRIRPTHSLNDNGSNQQNKNGNNEDDDFFNILFSTP